TFCINSISANSRLSDLLFHRNTYSPHLRGWHGKYCYVCGLSRKLCTFLRREEELVSAITWRDPVVCLRRKAGHCGEYQRRREMDTREKALWATRAKEGDGADEEQRRQLYLTSINRWLFVACDELESLSEEVRILQHQQSLKEHVSGFSPEPQRVPVKPFVISKHVAQNRVFGSAYPSLPSMTVVEWYEEHKRKGVLPDQGIPAATFGQFTKQEQEEEEEDEDSLQRARQWDDWKDTHRRGWGNRQNMG
uniref:Immunoglobulin (CD79A) binding protein 1 n=1 Tax=Eptatretus burgeri TaxID=7764 RepID=A0A8C4N5V5_EPTBU